LRGCIQRNRDQIVIGVVVGTVVGVVLLVLDHLLLAAASRIPAAVVWLAHPLTLPVFVWILGAVAIGVLALQLVALRLRR